MPRTATLSPDALDVLARAGSGPAAVWLPDEQLTRPLYVEVNKALVSLGGKWDRHANAHKFPTDPRPGLELLLASGVVPRPEQKESSFWRTPRDLATVMAHRAGLAGWSSTAAVTSDQCRVLEPSAGDGAIVRVLSALNPRLHIVAVEPNQERAAHLGAAGATEVHAVTVERFFGVEARGFAAVVMNPPFTLPGDHLAYASHLERILDHLECTEGGRILCVAPSGFQTRGDRRIAQLRSRVLDDHGGAILPVADGTFAESGTAVRTVLVDVEVTR